MNRVYESNVKCIFVSSTFKDMHSERDLIRDRVEPVLKDFAEKYGRIIQMVDLRWGVNTKDLSEEESSRKVLMTCLSEIDRCRPYFIALLGNRYGWVPNQETMRETVGSRDYRPNEPAISVTELEIEYGVLRSQVDPVCFFYMREGLDPLDMDETQQKNFFDEGEMQARQEGLKQKITGRYGDRVRHYGVSLQNGNILFSDNLADLIVADIEKALLAEWGEQPAKAESWQAKEQKKIESAVFHHLVRFRGRRNCVAYLKNFALHAPGGPSMLMVKGESGSGKSGLLSRLYDELAPEKLSVLLCFCGLSPESSTPEGILRILIRQLSDRLGRPDESENITDFEKLRHYFINLLEEASKGKTVLLIVDALDQLFHSEASRKMSWLGSGLPENVRLICSITDGEEIGHFRNLGGVVWEMPPLSKEDVREIAVSAAGEYHKELDRRVIETVAECAVPGGGKTGAGPLYLLLLVQDLTMISRTEFEKIDQAASEGRSVDDSMAEYMIGLVHGTSGDLKTQFMKIIGRVEQMISVRFVRAVLCALAVSRNGLRETELEYVCAKLDIGWSNADFSWLRQILIGNLIQKESGQWDFAHRAYRDSIRQVFEKKLLSYNWLVLKCFAARRATDPFAAREVLYHAQFQDDAEIACELLFDKKNFTENFRIYGRSLAEGFCDPYIGGRYPGFLLKVLDCLTAPYDDCSISMVTYYYLVFLMPRIDNYETNEEIDALLKTVLRRLDTRGYRSPLNLISKIIYAFAKDRDFAMMRRELIFEYLRLAANRAAANGDMEKFRVYDKRMKSFRARGFDENAKNMLNVELSAYRQNEKKLEDLRGSRNADGGPVKESIRNAYRPGTSLTDAFLDRDGKYVDDFLSISKGNYERSKNSGYLYKAEYEFEYLKARIHSGARYIANGEVERGMAELSETEKQLEGLALPDKKGEVDGCAALLQINLAKGFLRQNDPGSAAVHADRALGLVTKAYRQQQSFEALKLAGALLFQLTELFIELEDDQKCRQSIDSMTEAAELMAKIKNGAETKGMLFGAYCFKGEYSDWMGDTEQKYLYYSKAYEIYQSLPAVYRVTIRKAAGFLDERQQADFLSGIGGLCRHRGSYGEAADYYTQSLKAYGKAGRRELGDDYLDYLLVLSELALCCKKKGDERAARDYFGGLTGLANPEELANLGGRYYSGVGIDVDDDQAAVLYRIAAEKGNADAQNGLAACYAAGRGVKRDLAEAVKWGIMSAKKGHTEAQWNMGICCESGIGTPKDEAQAVKWYTMAAENGYPQAQVRLGHICFHGSCGEKRDYARAVKWYTMAAEQGNSDAQFSLGRCYYNGEGVGKDPEKAKEWWSKAARQGQEDAVKKLKEYFGSAAE